MLHSYPSIYSLGHRAIAEIFNEEVIIEEKIDGSQFSFSKLDDGTLHCKSKGKAQDINAPDKLFNEAIETVKRLSSFLNPNWIYRAEYLKKPKHNTLSYDRIPKSHLILFDVNTGIESYLSYEEKQAEAERLGLEVVPLIYRGKITSAEEIYSLLNHVSILGNTKIEGVVIKNYIRYGIDKKILIAKHVSEAFKEIHGKEWNKSNPKGKDAIETIIDKYKTEARWNKAIQHLRENGELENSPSDIGKLIKEIHDDIVKECLEDIKNDLYKWAKDRIHRGILSGFPEYYKQSILIDHFKKREEK